MKYLHLPLARRDIRRTICLILACLLIACLASCTKSYNRYLKLPADPQTADLGWARVSSAYARIRESPDSSSPDLGALRADTIFQLLERRIDPRGAEAGGYWYRCSEQGVSGWVHGGDIEVFKSEAGARAAPGSGGR